jgi:hypothetical protein
MGCPETSVENYHSQLSKIPKARRSHLYRGGSLISLDSLLQSPFDILKEDSDIFHVWQKLEKS